MKDKFIHGLSATIVITIGILIGCSDNVSDAPDASSEISSDQTNSSALESSGSEVSSSEIPGSVPSSSASSNSSAGPSSSAAASSCSAENPTSSATSTTSSVTGPSSSAEIPSSSVSSSAASNSTDPFSSEPIARSSSSYSKLRDEPQDERHTIYRLLYPVENGTLDTGFFDQGGCDIKTDGSFTCHQSSCIEYVGGYISSSTRSEIKYAKVTGKPVRYLEEE